MINARIIRPTAATEVDPYDVRHFPRPAAYTEHSICVDHDPELFFSDGDHRKIQQAKRVCSLCPVRIECLNEAISMGDNWGVRGGLTPSERATYGGVA